MRRCLDAIYLASGSVAAFFVLAIAIAIGAQMLSRFVDVALDMTEVSGFCLAASTFFGLSYTLHHGSHIRIDAAIRHLGPTGRKVAELWCCAVGILLMSYFSYNAIFLCIQLWKFGDMSRGLVPVPFWIPESSMAIGAVLLTLALLDDFIQILQGRRPQYMRPDSELEQLELASDSVNLNPHRGEAVRHV